MRRIIAATAGILLAQGFAQTCFAQGGSFGVDLAVRAPRHVESCTVAALDSVTMNFLCATRRGLQQYWVTRSTRFVGSWPNNSFFDLTTGQPVQVTFHNAGALAIADVVSF